jgi:hypothetical protein
MTTKQKIEELKKQLSRVLYGQAGTFPHPGWFEEEKRIREEIKKLEESSNETD